MDILDECRNLGAGNPESTAARAANEIERLRDYILSLDGKTIGTRTDGDTFIDEGFIVASDVLGPR